MTPKKGTIPGTDFCVTVLEKVRRKRINTQIRLKTVFATFTMFLAACNVCKGVS